MQLRYLAAAGAGEAIDELARRLSSSAPRLELALRRSRLAVWSVSGTPWTTGGAAVAIGAIFSRADGKRLERSPEPLPPDEDLAARYWGPYVIIKDCGGSAAQLWRDPSGAVTAYHRRCAGLDIYASDAALLALVERLEADREFLRQWLTFPALRAGATGIGGVCEILPGSKHGGVSPEKRTSLFWQPWDYARRDRTIDTFEDAATALRDTILRSVPALAGQSDEVVLELSGGLDSSIVAAALAHAGCRFRAVTFATRAPDGDERFYAREVARHCGVQLAEIAEEEAVPDFRQIPAPALRPPPNALLLALRQAISVHLAEGDPDLVFDGAGGDNVFCYLGSAAPALDALRRRGPAIGLAALRNLARLHGTTLWSAANAARKRARRPPLAWPRDETFLAPGAGAPSPPEHPWLGPLDVADRSTAEHVRSLAGIYHFLEDPQPGGVAALHPLLAQPIVETCLRIPSWLWVDGGRDRAVARAAFDGLLPASILNRRSKGYLGSMFVTGYMAARGQLAELLLDGRLADYGLLDRAAIHAYLRRDRQPDDARYLRLLDLASAEVWLRSLEA